MDENSESAVVEINESAVDENNESAVDENESAVDENNESAVDENSESAEDENNELIIGSELSHEKKEFTDSVSNFLEVVYGSLECPVCLNYMVPPILLCESGHNICSKCKPFIYSCPLCRGPFLKARNIALETQARNLKLLCTSEDCDKGCLGLKNNQENQIVKLLDDQTLYTCPLSLYKLCFWRGKYSDIRKHMEEEHASQTYIQRRFSLDLTLAVKDVMVIFAFDEIFLYKEELDVCLIKPKFYIQVSYVGRFKNHNNFSYLLELSTKKGKQTYSIHNRTLPENDVRYPYTFSAGHCTVLDYSIVSRMTYHHDLKCTLSLKKCSQE